MEEHIACRRGWSSTANGRPASLATSEGRRAVVPDPVKAFRAHSRLGTSWTCLARFSLMALQAHEPLLWLTTCEYIFNALWREAAVGGTH
jgi:hypothetical protein